MYCIWTLQSLLIEILGGLIFYLQPLLNVPGFQWKLQAFFYIYCRYAPHILYICIWLFSIFLLSPYSNEIFMLRLQGVPISYPQLLLNLWVDFNENFRHSSTYIGDVHPKAMQMLYEIWLFSIVLVSHIEKWILSYHTWGGTHHLSTIPPWPVNGFQWNMCKSTAKW
jgi:hypothetical protein